MGENTNKTAKTPETLLAALPLVFMLVTLVLGLANGIDIKILILLCAIVTTFIVYFKVIHGLKLNMNLQQN